MFIRKIRRKDISHGSIQVLAERAVSRENNGVEYAEAYPTEFLEASFVKIEGFNDATLKVMVMEAFWGDKVFKASVVQQPGAPDCPQCHSIQVVKAPNVENGFTCMKCGNQFTGGAKEDVSTGNAGGMTTTAIAGKPKEPFSVEKFAVLLAQSEEKAREYAAQYE